MTFFTFNDPLLYPSTDVTVNGAYLPFQYWQDIQSVDRLIGQSGYLCALL